MVPAADSAGSRVIAGVGLLTVGVITAWTGFSHEASALALPATGAPMVFAVGMMVTTWRATATGPADR